MSDFHTICQVADIPEGEARMFVVDGVMVGVFHVNNSTPSTTNARTLERHSPME